MAHPITVEPGEPPDLGRPVLRRSSPSRLDSKSTVIEAAVDLIIASGWVAERDRPWLLLCLDEAVVNAMVHGNEGDPKLPVEIAVHCDGSAWSVVVRDQGDGFAPAQLPDPDDPASLLLEHGRGIRIMCEWLDELTYYDHGRCAVLRRRIDPRTSRLSAGPHPADPTPGAPPAG